ncbi:MAG TPA: biopolymer transporter ExbD [Agitococcus sp.]|nr:biopolymer transporter ExbD [Agitococcus sp.]
MRSRTKNRDTNPELDITSFMNLMVILIPFLLLDAVFTQQAMLQVLMPSGEGAAAETPKPPLVLEVMVYKDKFLVADRQTGSTKTITTNAKGELDYKALNDYLRTVKTQYPLVTDASILLETDTAYDKLIHTMDAVRIVVSTETGREARYALFPDISIGDAPPDVGGAK